MVPTHQDPELILSPDCVGVVAWQVEEWVQQELQAAEVPSGAPPSTAFVLEEAHAQVLQWSHVSRVACHPRLARTLHLLHQWEVLSPGPSESPAATLDFVTGFPPLESNTMVLTIVKRFFCFFLAE